MPPKTIQVEDFPAEILRLRNEVQALAQANVHAAQLMAELEEARHTEGVLKANNLRLEQAKRLEENRAQYMELVAGNRPEDVLVASLGSMLHSEAPQLAFSFLLPAGGDLRHACSRGIPAPLSQEMASMTLSAASGVRKATALKRPVCVFDLGQPGSSTICKAIDRAGFQSLYCSPAFNAGGSLLGMLVVYGTEAREPDVDTRQLLDRITTLLSMGLNQRLMTERLVFHAHHDALTMLPNRTYFYEVLQDALAVSSVDGRKVAVLWADLDRFKQINDSLGHRTADLLLRMVAQRLAACVEGRAKVARMGGDEFVILMQGISGIEPAAALAESVVAAFRKPFGIGENNYTVGISIGVCVFPDQATDTEELVRNADIAMYAAKHSGRNSFVCFSARNEAAALESFQLEFHLRRALEMGEFELYYQPLVSCKYGTIAAFETLLRWFSPALGVVSPAQFIPVAEASGLILELGQWVLEQACLEAASWQAETPGIRVAVNVSVGQLLRGDFSRVVHEALRKSGLSPSLLELELTESAVIGLEDFQRHTDALRMLGVSLAIDDFGTGYSSLSYLHTLHIDTLKIDRSFVQAMGKEPASARLIETILAMAKSLGLQVVAEGVETLQQLQWLTDLQCDLLQGYYLHRPMPSQNARSLLRKDAMTVQLPRILAQ
jgi:diguanylate cyclase (GGDEF)-like protein